AGSCGSTIGAATISSVRPRGRTNSTSGAAATGPGPPGARRPTSSGAPVRPTSLRACGWRSGEDNVDYYNVLVEQAREHAEREHPEASAQHRAAFANSVAYLVTGWSGGYGGPSVREHAVSHAAAGIKPAG